MKHLSLDSLKQNQKTEFRRVFMQDDFFASDTPHNK